jgi:hypothetical protein
MTAPIDKDDFKTYFDRDFTFGESKLTIRDSDIDRAIAEAGALFNRALGWVVGTDLEIAYNFLTAHCLVTNIIAAGGIDKQGKGTGSTGTFAINSKSAGPLSVGYALPQELVDNPVLSQFMTTKYGQRYLELLIPKIAGNFMIAGGGTQP